MIRWRIATLIGFAVFMYWLCGEFLPMAVWR